MDLRIKLRVYSLLLILTVKDKTSINNIPAFSISSSNRTIFNCAYDYAITFTLVNVLVSSTFSNIKYKLELLDKTVIFLCPQRKNV